MTSQCSMRPIWHAWTNLLARGHTTGRLRAPHTQEALCGSSRHRRCSNRSRIPGRTSCEGTTAGLPRPIIVCCGSASSGLGRERLLQRHTAAQRQTLRHQPSPRAPAAAAAASCRQRRARAAPRPRALHRSATATHTRCSTGERRRGLGAGSCTLGPGTIVEKTMTAISLGGDLPREDKVVATAWLCCTGLKDDEAT